MRRSASFAIVCLFALACTSCSSNNTGKIVGKWKASSADLGVEEYLDIIGRARADEPAGPGQHADGFRPCDAIARCQQVQSIDVADPNADVHGALVDCYEVVDVPFMKACARSEIGRTGGKSRSVSRTAAALRPRTVSGG